MKAAAHVDRVLAPRLHTVGVTLLDRTVAQAIAKHLPEEHATREERSKATWDVVLHHPNPTEYAGTSELHITGDTLTLTHLHDRICATAADLKTHGDPDPLGVRKVTALRSLAGTPKTKLYLHLDHADLDEHTGSAGPRSSAPPPSPRSATGSATPGSPSNPSSAWTAPTRSTPTTHPPGCATWSSSATPAACSRTANATPAAATSTTPSRTTTPAHPAKPDQPTSPPSAEDTTAPRPPAAGNTDDYPTAPTNGPAQASSPAPDAQAPQVQWRRITVATSNGSLPRCAASTPAPSGEPV